LSSVITSYIKIQDSEVKYLEDNTLKNKDMKSNESNFILNNPIMLTIISYLSFKNAFKQKKDTKINYNLSFLCFWLQNMKSFPYFYSKKNLNNAVKRNKTSYKKKHNEEDELVSLSSSTNISLSEYSDQSREISTKKLKKIDSNNKTN
jgi:hypothetical protein